MGAFDEQFVTPDARGGKKNRRRSVAGRAWFSRREMNSAPCEGASPAHWPRNRELERGGAVPAACALRGAKRACLIRLGRGRRDFSEHGPGRPLRRQDHPFAADGIHPRFRRLANRVRFADAVDPAHQRHSESRVDAGLLSRSSIKPGVNLLISASTAVPRPILPHAATNQLRGNVPGCRIDFDRPPQSRRARLAGYRPENGIRSPFRRPDCCRWHRRSYPPDRPCRGRSAEFHSAGCIADSDPTVRTGSASGRGQRRLRSGGPGLRRSRSAGRPCSGKRSAESR